MASKACILCDAKPPPALTHEHIWPEWYNQQQPNFNYELESEVNGAVDVRPTTSMNLKPKVLCVSCNTKWGSSLEKRIRPILTPMIRGEPTQLGEDEMQLISAWLYLKAMVSEYVAPANAGIRRFHDLAQGRHLRATLRPPAGTLIWIGRYVGSRAEAAWITDRKGPRRISEEPPAGVFWRSVVYTIGQVLLHLFATTRPIPLGDVEDGHLFEWRVKPAPAEWDTALTRIWQPPGVQVDWPPQKAFDDDATVYLVERWNPEKAPSPQSPPEETEPSS